jgi:hypothetical protein
MSKSTNWLHQTAPRLLWGLGILVLSCTSARENSENNATTPATIDSDAERKAIYNQGAVSNEPSAVPRNLNNQASEINRQKQIEKRGADLPHNRPLEVRTEELGRPPTDTLPREN